MSSRDLKLGLDLVQTLVHHGLLGHKLGEQPVVRKVRVADHHQQGKDNADDAGPIACGQANGVVVALEG
jgi:hypothetical protein